MVRRVSQFKERAKLIDPYELQPTDGKKSFSYGLGDTHIFMFSAWGTRGTNTHMLEEKWKFAVNEGVKDEIEGM